MAKSMFLNIALAFSAFLQEKKNYHFCLRYTDHITCKTLNTRSKPSPR